MEGKTTHKDVEVCKMKFPSSAVGAALSVENHYTTKGLPTFEILF